MCIRDRYTEVSAIAGLSATIDTIIGWFTQDPIDKLANDVEDISEQTSNLNDKLEVAVPELQTAADLLQDYKGLLTQIENLCNSDVELSTDMFVNMKEVGQSQMCIRDRNWVKGVHEPILKKDEEESD